MPERDPNEGSTDPMVPDYWLLGEAIQDRIIAAGYDQETVDGIAVDIHDSLQAADLIEADLGPSLVKATTKEELQQAILRLQNEFRHLEWHGKAAQAYLDSVLNALD